MTDYAEMIEEANRKYDQTVTIGGVPESLNKTLGMNRFSYMKYRKKWYWMVHLAFVGKKPPAPLRVAEIHYVRHASRFLDFENLVGSLKPVTDGLRYSKVISDDNWDLLTSQNYFVDQVKCKRGQEKLVITVKGFTKNQKEGKENGLRKTIQ